MSSIDFLLTKLDEVVDGKVLFELLSSGAVDEARIMHKEEIKQAFNNFGGAHDEFWEKAATHYYNETFGEINLMYPAKVQ
jgi:hypothetical protein